MHHRAAPMFPPKSAENFSLHYLYRSYIICRSLTETCQGGRRTCIPQHRRSQTAHVKREREDGRTELSTQRDDDRNHPHAQERRRRREG